MKSLRANRTPSFRLFIEFVKNSFQSQLAYRIDTLILLAGQLIILFIKISIWTAVMKNRIEISGNSVDLDDMITYAVIGTLLIIFVNRQLISQIGRLVTSGDAAIQLLRPVKFRTQTIFEQIGKNLSTFLIEFLPIFIIVNFLYRINYPGLIYGFLFLLSFINSIILNFYICFTLGLLAFWLYEIRQVDGLYRIFLMAFSGSFIPLWFFPDKIAQIVGYLPFQLLIFTPAAIFMEKMTVNESITGIVTQLIWIFCLILIEKFVWNRAVKKIVIQGG